jgi:hypothetical protein
MAFKSVMHPHQPAPVMIKTVPNMMTIMQVD